MHRPASLQLDQLASCAGFTVPGLIFSTPLATKSAEKSVPAGGAARPD